MSKELEDRLARLEETVYFQEQALRELNDALVRQQAQLDETERLLEAARERLRSLTRMMEDDGGEDTGPPPHYL
jgi:SlyX protein